MDRLYQCHIFTCGLSRKIMMIPFILSFCDPICCFIFCIGCCINLQCAFAYGEAKGDHDGVGSVLCYKWQHADLWAALSNEPKLSSMRSNMQLRHLHLNSNCHTDQRRNWKEINKWIRRKHSSWLERPAAWGNHDRERSKWNLSLK